MHGLANWHLSQKIENSHAQMQHGDASPKLYSNAQGSNAISLICSMRLEVAPHLANGAPHLASKLVQLIFACLLHGSTLQGNSEPYSAPASQEEPAQIWGVKVQLFT